MNDSVSPEQLNAERTYSGVSLSDRAAQRRERLIQSGIEVFGREGYQAATIRKIAAASGLTNRYFYQSFGSMEELLMACYESLMTDFKVHLTDVLETSGTDPKTRIRAGLHCFFSTMAQPEFARVTHSEVLGVSPQVDELYSRYTADFAKLMMRYLPIPMQQMSAEQRQYLGAGLVGAVMNAGIAWVRSKYQAPIDVVVDTTLQIFMGTVAVYESTAKSTKL